MTSKRLAYLVNIPLKLLPFSEAQQKAYEKTGFVRQLAFRTIPSVGKVDLKEYLEKVYGFSVASINTLNYEGRKKRAKVPNTPGALLFYRRAGYKKAYVTLKPPAAS